MKLESGAVVSPKTGVIISALIIILAMVVYAGYCMAWPIWEDAYISFRYAHNWASGNGLVYNSGERVEGYTNFLWVTLIAFSQYLNIDPWISSRVLGFLSVTGVFLAILIFYWKRMPSKYSAAVLSCMLIALSQQVIRWAGSGLETGLFTCLVCAAMFYSIGTDPDKWPIAPGVLWVLAILCRPDAVVFLAALLPALWFEKHRRPASMKLIAIVTVLLIPYFLWKLYYFGMILPATYHTRMGYTGSQTLQGVTFIGAYLRNHWILYLGLLTVPLWWKKENTHLRACGFAIIIHLIYVALVGGDWMEYRFFSVSTPLAIVLAVEFIWHLFFRMPAHAMHLKTLGNRFAGALVLAGLLFTVIMDHTPHLLSHHYFSEGSLQRLFDHRTNRSSVGALLGRFARENGYSDQWLVTHYAEVAYTSRMNVHNPFGLTELETALMKVDSIGTGRVAHEKVNWKSGLAKRPIFIFPDYESPDYTAIRTPTADGQFSRFSVRKDIQDEFLSWWDQNFSTVPRRKF